MFSAVRLHSCRTMVTETVEADGGEQVRPVNLRMTIHQAWITHLSRNRRDVVQAFLVAAARRRA